jgi:hypothetical protein
MQQVNAMDPETAAKWNDWLTTYVARALEAHDETMVDATAEFVSEYVHKRLKDETAKLREEIGSLRADLTLLRAEVAGTIRKLRDADTA